MIMMNTQYYVTEIESIKRELKTIPDGHLTKRGSQFYHTTATTQKGITRDPWMVKQLARKAYLLRRLKHLEWNNSVANKQAMRYLTEEPIEIIQCLPSFYQTLQIDWFFKSPENRAFGTTRHGDSGPGHTEELIYITNSGLHVRSKSERTIADALDSYKIHYRYETRHVLGSHEVYPDFTIYRPADSKLIIWEHFGLMDRNDYKQKTTNKIITYAKHGFFPFDNLICTYENDLRNTSQIHDLIRNFLLR